MPPHVHEAYGYIKLLPTSGRRSRGLGEDLIVSTQRCNGAAVVSKGHSSVAVLPLDLLGDPRHVAYVDAELATSRNHRTLLCATQLELVHPGAWIEGIDRCLWGARSLRAL